MTTARAFASYAVFTLLLVGCGGEDTPRVQAGTAKPAFQQDVPVRQLLPAPADSTWKEQAPVRTPIKVGPDSLPVMVEWTPAHRESHRAISRINVAFPEHANSDSLSAQLSGGPINHGTRAAILEGLTLEVRWTSQTSRAAQLATTVVHLSGDGKAKLY